MIHRRMGMTAGRRAVIVVLAATATAAAQPVEQQLQAIADAKAAQYNCTIGIGVYGSGMQLAVAAGVSDRATGQSSAQSSGRARRQLPACLHASLPACRAAPRAGRAGHADVTVQID